MLVLLIADLTLGSVLISIRDIIDVIKGDSQNQNWIDIIWIFRAPKAITSILVGAGLSVAGLMMQTLFRNPLAGPYVLGISSGANLGVALFTLSAGYGGIVTVASFQAGAMGIVLAAIIGAALVMMLVLLVSARVADSVSILIIGIMFGSITGALVSVLQYFSDPDAVHSFLVWTFGSVAGVEWQHLIILAPIVMLGIVFSFVMQKPLNAFMLGENYARGIGLDVKKARFFLILFTSIIAGGITAFTGPIAFIGMAVPHITRNLLRTSNHKVLIPGVLVTGAALMLVCDIISQLPGSNQMLPINSVTAIFGAPVVIWVIITARKGKTVF